MWCATLMGKLQDLDALTTKSHCCPDPTDMFMLFWACSSLMWEKYWGRKGASLWPNRDMIQTLKNQSWINSVTFFNLKIKMNTYCIPWSVHRSSRDSLWPCCTLCSSLCTPRCDTWTSLDHYTESLQGGLRSRRKKKNNLIQHLDVRVRIKTWKQLVQASCGCAM